MTGRTCLYEFVRHQRFRCPMLGFAWRQPGVNRGLLTELKSEAELAARAVA
ncbi:MAG: hypothetical protein IPK39_24090 [Sulfuritalea sp.]|nr:hypothetical protein [Sulfuritalea sp.]